MKDGSWRYCRAALYANHTIKPDVVTVGGKDEKHPEGNYCVACAGPWIPAGPDALKAQRQRHALLSGNSQECPRYSGRPVPKAVVQPEEMVANGRKRVKDEISKYLDNMIARKRPGKSVRQDVADGCCNPDSGFRPRWQFALMRRIGAFVAAYVAEIVPRTSGKGRAGRSGIVPAARLDLRR